MNRLPTVITDFGVNIILVGAALFTIKLVGAQFPNSGFGKFAKFI